jgi:Reversibly glycosylated polypeptide
MTPPTRVDIVMTTIGDASAFFDAYRKALDGRSETVQVRFVVIADRRTPVEFWGVCARARDAGLDVLAPTVAEQDELLRRLGVPGFVPYDSDNRRNIGYLLSRMGGADLLISVDDDNVPAGTGFLDEHLVVVAGPHAVEQVDVPGGWWNPCTQLRVRPMMVYPRGFPYSQRVPAQAVRSRQVVDVRVNAGLWLGDPDVDAITRIAVRPEAQALHCAEAVVGRHTWAPVNSQNTAVHRDAVAAYYFPRMGYRTAGVTMDRYADIFSGYFVQACAKHLGHGVRFGGPVTRHDRNSHVLFGDLERELPAIVVLDDVLAWLHGCTLDGSTYAEAYRSLSHRMQDAVEAMTGRGWTEEMRGFFHQMAFLMRQWLLVLDRAGGAN